MPRVTVLRGRARTTLAALLSLGLATALACGGGETDDPAEKSGRAGSAGGGGYFEDLGGAGGRAGRAGAGGKAIAGQGGTSSAAGKGGTGGSSIGGAGGVSPTGGAAGGLVCPTTTFQPLPTCDDDDLPPCFACLCTATPACKEAFTACEADPGCSKTVDCGRSGCSYTECAKLAGSGLKKALDVRECAEITCAVTCGAAMGGTAGASGASHTQGGSAGSGGVEASAGAAGDGKSTMGGAAGGGAKAPAAPPPMDQGGAAGSAGEGGSPSP